MVDIESSDFREVHVKISTEHQRLLTVQFPVPADANFHDIALAIADLGDAAHSLSHEVQADTGRDWDLSNGEPMGSAFLLFDGTTTDENGNSQPRVLLPYIIVMGHGDAPDSTEVWAQLSSIFETAGARLAAQEAERIANGEA